jgi:hypothetical protein
LLSTLRNTLLNIQYFLQYLTFFTIYFNIWTKEIQEWSEQTQHLANKIFKISHLLSQDGGQPTGGRPTHHGRRSSWRLQPAAASGGRRLGLEFKI